MGRVRVGVRLRPLTRQEKATQDPDEIPVVEASPETNRILLRRSQWDGESYQFDQAYPPHTSQKRIYELVAAPVVESVLNGYNGGGKRDADPLPLDNVRRLIKH